MPQPAQSLPLALALALGALSTLPACQNPESFQEQQVREDGVAADRPIGTPIALPSRPEFAEVARLEEQRDVGGGRLFELLRTSDAPVRARAALALGRMPLEVPGDAVTMELCRALEDPDPGVRRRAAFGLYLRGDETAAGVLARHWHDPDASVRAAIVRAGAKLGERELKEDLLRSLSDPDPAVRLEAVAGMALWSPEARDAGRIDGELLGVLDPRTRGGTAARGPSVEESWLTLYALARRNADRGRAAFLEHVDDVEVHARLFATKGLANIEPEPGATRALERRARDTDWRVACEALRGLANHADPASLTVVEEALRHPSAHVRRVAAETFGAFEGAGARTLDPLLRAVKDRSPAVRAAALGSLARTGDPVAAVGELRSAAEDQDETVRAGAAAALAHVRTDQARPLLEALADDESHLVAGAALESLGAWGDERSIERLRAELDGQPDLGRRLGALLALEEHASEADLPHLESAIASSAGDIAAELAAVAMKHAGLIGGERAQAILERGMRYQHPFVRRTAREQLAELVGADELPEIGAPPAADRTMPPLPGIDYPAFARNPLIEVRTSRGIMVFELYPADAPVHVHNLLTLAESGHYDGTTFHRVVPDFVIQGGDPRGDGNGGTDWRGGSLRAEFNERKYLRGSLGMPRWDDVDSGGAQLFVTHRPTPHLDGRYTLFGQLVRGFDVLDLIEPGDRIVSIVRLAEPRLGTGLR